MQTATGDAADVLALLEREFPIPNIYPFAGMTNRSFWVRALGSRDGCWGRPT